MAATPQEKKQFIRKGMGMVEEGLPGWFGTFADMMTLLFAFFVLLAAISTIDPVKLQNMADGMGKSVGKKEEIEKEFGFQLQYSDLQIARHLLNRLVAFFEHLSKAEIKLAELEVLSLEPMSEELTDRAIKSGRLAGHSCFDADQIAEVEEWTPKHATAKQVQKPIDEEIPEPAANEGDDSSSHALETIDCRDKSLVITDSAEKIRSLMLRTDESGLFPTVDERDSPHRDTKTKENLDWRSSGKAFGELFSESWIRIKISDA